MLKAAMLVVASVISFGMTSWVRAEDLQPASAVKEQSALAGRAQTLVANATPVQLKAQITSIDRESRIITLHGANGRDMNVVIGDQVANFDQLHVGDSVEVLYKNALLVSADKVLNADRGIRKRVDSTVYQMTPSGYSAARQIEVQATVLGINAKKRELRVRGAYRTETLGVGPDIDLKTLKVGDTIHAVFVSAYATKVTPVDAGR